ncbi:MAG: hypothetical protein ABJB49_10315, partial [Nitrospirota bacterium]
LVVRARHNHLQPSTLALAAVAAGELDEAIQLCEKAVKGHDAHILWAVSETWDGWQPLYAHPKWRGVRQGILTWRKAPAVKPALL